MYEETEGPLLDQLLEEYFYQHDGPRNELHFMNSLDVHLNNAYANKNEHATTDKYEPVSSPIPKSFLIARTINDKTSSRILTVLFDSGGSGCWINERVLPRDCKITILDQPKSSLTLAGTLSSHRVVCLHKIILPEFDRNKIIEQQGAYVFSGPCNYDLIFGRDFLSTTGIILDFDKGLMQWMDKTIPMHGCQHTHNAELAESFAVPILESKYDKWTPGGSCRITTPLDTLAKKRY
jgi:hypothetical protein